MAVAFIDDRNAPVTLGRELGRGGEGSVYELAGTNLVAKIYHRAVEQSKAEKLEAMVRLKAASLTAIAAWPERRILDKNGRSTWGVVLPRVTDHREIHHLYSPAHRKVDFPTADWSFLIHVARNCAAAFESIHSAGHVVGDVNQGGILVSRKGTVTLIDCDSFQVSDGRRLFTCDVGVPHFTAPELQGKAFRGLHRATTHDSFGLAVLVFHLLFMGRHPFAGRYHGPGDMPIELAIQQGRFAYGAAAAKVQMTPPPHALRLSHVPPTVADLFERAFRHGVGQPIRPPALEWVRALDDLKKSLIACSRFPGHKFVNTGSRACPWCEIERGGGPDLFISITASAKLNSTFNINLLWHQVEAVAAPKPVSVGTVTANPVPSAPLPPTTRISGFVTLASGVVAAISIVLSMTGVSAAAGLALITGLLWAILRSVSPYAKARKSLLGEVKKTTSEVMRAESEWRSKMEGLTKAFADKKQALAKLRSEYQTLPQVFRKEEEEFQSKKREHQLKAFLRSHFIEDASIKGIGPGRISVLRSFGIETALDVTEDRVSAVDGFGPTRTGAVMGWRWSVEAKFRFDPNKAVDPAERSALVQRQSQRRATIEAALTRGVTELQQIRTMADQAWQMHQHRYTIAAVQRERAVNAASALTFPSWAA
jgi:DNA-binding helix-hairpin-helix protein with protein kinase domain